MITPRCLAVVFSAMFTSIAIAPTIALGGNHGAFRNAVEAVEKRNYDQLRSILEQNPQVMVQTDKKGNSLFVEFLNVFYEDTGLQWGNAADLKAIGILLDYGAIPNVSNGLLSSLLSEANHFGGAIDAYPVNSGICTDNRASYFPLINRLIEAGAPFGAMELEISGFHPSEAFFYQYQLCFRPFVCGAEHEQASSIVTGRVSLATTSREKELLIELAADGSHLNACLLTLNDW